MKKLFLSADIEGTAGIVHWDETQSGKDGYGFFRQQMTREVAAACEAAREAGAGEIVVKDAHGSARNLLPDGLPEGVKLFRGWARHPYCMMYGLDESFDGVFLTGYHSSAGTNCNPLSHTMSGDIQLFTINGEIAPEAMINSLTAAMLGVPVLLLTGDSGLCEWMRGKNPNIETVPVNEGTGSGALCLHPADAVRLIRAAAARALRKDPASCMFPMPKRFALEVTYYRHADAMGASFYPGARLSAPKTVSFETDSWMEALRFLHFVM